MWLRMHRTSVCFYEMCSWLCLISKHVHEMHSLALLFHMCHPPPPLWTVPRKTDVASDLGLSGTHSLAVCNQVCVYCVCLATLVVVRKTHVLNKGLWAHKGFPWQASLGLTRFPEHHYVALATLIEYTGFIRRFIRRFLGHHTSVVAHCLAFVNLVRTRIAWSHKAHLACHYQFHILHCLSVLVVGLGLLGHM